MSNGLGIGTMRFDFATATKIVFGSGKIREAVSAAATLGTRALVVTGKSLERVNAFIADMQGQGIGCTLFSVRGEPTIACVIEGIGAARGAACDIVVGFGGGSALDAAKAIAALMTNPGDPLNYLEVVGSGAPLREPCAPCICIPTTAGTGTEVTRNAVLVSPEHRIKVSLRSPRMFPSLAVVDPALTFSLPVHLTASTGMDALTQVIEPFVSVAANPMTDAICRDGIGRAARWLRTACADGRNAEARENMALVSLFGGLALANSGLGAVHGLAAPMGGRHPIPHGVVCARLLPGIMETNLRALRMRQNDSPALARYDEIARLLTGSLSARANDGIAYIRAMCSDLAVPRFSGCGLSPADLPDIAANALKSSSMKGNPVPLTLEELTEVLNASL